MFCRHCGTHARPDDRHCTKCGEVLNHDGQTRPEPSFTRYTPPESGGFRVGRFIAAHAKGLLILAAIAVLGGIAALSASSPDTTPGPADAAPSAAVSTEADAVDRQSTVPTPSDPTKTRTSPAPKRVSVTGADGRTYYCSGAALDEADSDNARVERREKLLRQRRSTFRAFLRQHPEKALASPDYARYKYLRARLQAQLKFTNRAIRAYNHVLGTRCDPA